MSVQFFTEYPLWFIIICFAAGFLYSFLLYWRAHSDNTGYGSRRLIYLMAAFRFLSVSAIAFLLLNPLLKFISTEIEKPIVVLAIDNSESIMNNRDSAAYRKGITSLIQQFNDLEGNDLKVDFYCFGDKPLISNQPNYRDKQTDFSGLFTEIGNVYSGSNVGAMVLLSDGIYNKGAHPVYAAGNLKFPVYTVGLGDTTVRKDLKITNVRSNSIAYLNNHFPAVIDIQADKCQGQPYKLTVTNNQSVVYETTITPGSASDFKTITIDLEAKAPGIMHYTAVLTRLNGEVTYANNQKDFFIEVIDARQKVLIAGRSPHPDITALRQAIGSNMNYEVSIDVSGTLSQEKALTYDIVVLHQLPCTAFHVTMIEALKAKRIPVLFVMGRQTNFNLFNNLKTGLSYTATGSGFNQPTGLLNTNFNLFENSETVKSDIGYYPPLTVPFGNFSYKDAGQIMIYQQIGSLKTNQPLVAFNDDNGMRYGFITGEGFWRWRMMDFDKNHNHDVTNELVCKAIQYLAASSDKRKFRAYATENTYFENEPVIFNAEYYNQSFELVNKPEIGLTLTNEKGINYTYTFSRTNTAYQLNTGSLAPGRYTYLAKVKSGGANETVKGMLIVKPLQMEFTDTRANHEVLKQLALTTGGKFLNFNQTAQLSDILKKLETIKPVMYENKDYRDLINQKWVFFLILALISAEWFLRKRNGAY